MTMFSSKAIQLPSPSVLFASLLFLFLIIKQWKKSNGAKKDPPSKLLPGPKMLPLLGNLHQMMGSIPHHSLRDLARRYGPIMCLQLGEIRTIVISSADTVKEILGNNELAFAQRPEIAAHEVMSYENSSFVFSPYGEYWKQMRKICVLELLSMKKVLSFRSIREQESWNVMKAIQSSQGKPVNLTKMVLRLINDVTSRAAFGERCKYREEFLSFLEGALKISGGFELPDLFPSIRFLRYLSRNKPAWEKLHKKIDLILDHIIEEHKKKLKGNGGNDEEDKDAREDLVDVLLKLQKSSEINYFIKPNVIKTVVMEIFAAGTDPSSMTIDWAFSEMLRNPRVMEKAQAEVRAVLKGKTQVREQDIQGLEYLKLVVKESLRMHPPATLITRESREACVINGYEIPRKTKILINSYAVGRDPKFWTDPESFVPERFLNSSVDFGGSSFEYIPFGGGRRICPGINFGLANVELPLAQLLYHFDWSLADGIKAQDLDMSENFGVTCRRKSPLILIAEPRVPFSYDGDHDK